MSIKMTQLYFTNYFTDGVIFEMTLGKRIKRLRIKQGLTQDNIAEMINKKRTNVSGYESDNVLPPSDVLSKLADILHTSTDYLLGKTENPEPLSTEVGFLRKINLSDEELIEEYNIMLDGESLSVEEVRAVLAFLRTTRSLK